MKIIYCEEPTKKDRNSPHIIISGNQEINIYDVDYYSGRTEGDWSEVYCLEVIDFDSLDEELLIAEWQCCELSHDVRPLTEAKIKELSHHIMTWWESR